MAVGNDCMRHNSPGGGLSLPQGVEAVEWTGLVVMILLTPIVYLVLFPGNELFHQKPIGERRKL